MRDDNRCVYVFNIEQETSGRLWDELAPLVDPDELFYAAWINGYHNEPYFLDVLLDNEQGLMDSFVIEALHAWIDEFYMNWAQILEVTRKRKSFNLDHCRVDPATHTLYVVFKRRAQDEGFYPTYG